jgi:hypothetical protein
VRAPRIADWQAFVIAHGWRAHAYELAAIVGQTEEAIQRLRATGACARLDKAKDFSELFALWHRREPGDDDWPAPRKMGSGKGYEWQPPEVALLASLVGQISQAEIAEVLTARLREKTGDAEAERTATAVQVRTNQIGLQTTDVVGGLTTSEAAREIGSFAIVNQAIAKGEIPTHRVGRLHVIPYDAWRNWKEGRTFPPEGYVQLSTLREPLGIKSDKLSEYARMGLVPTALRCNPYGKRGPSTQFGTWWISKETADQILAHRRAGRAMPWHGKYADNLRTTYRLWSERKHPPQCKDCMEIWGAPGAPKTFEEYATRYPGLAHGAKHHLTRPWSPGTSLEDVARQSGKTVQDIQRAIDNGVLAATSEHGVLFVTKTEATRWIARKCPNGEGNRSWISLEDASSLYFFTMGELRGLIDDGALRTRVGSTGTASGVELVLRHQCGQLREKIGFTEEQAARRLGISVARFRHLVDGVDWRGSNLIPLATVQAVRKRLESRAGYTIDEAAVELGVADGWVKEQIARGTIRVSRAKWDRRRLYITEPMLKRLREAAKQPREVERLGADWLSLSDAALEAAVSLATLNAWGVKGELAFREHKGVRYFHREAVRIRARAYWTNPRLHRAIPPAWLSEEALAECAA